MEGKCWISYDTCITGPDGVPYCKMLRDSPENSGQFVHKGFVVQEGKDPRPLIGRRADRHSGEWRYYTTDSDGEGRLQYPIIFKSKNCMTSTLGCTELSNGDHVSVQGFDGQDFSVTLL